MTYEIKTIITVLTILILCSLFYVLFRLDRYRSKKEQIPYRIVLNGNEDYVVQCLRHKNGVAYWEDRFFYVDELGAKNKYNYLIGQHQREINAKKIIKVIDVKH